MNTILTHIGYVFFFWAVWQALDVLVWGVLLGKKKKHELIRASLAEQERDREVDKLNKGVETLAKGVASLMVDMHALKEQRVVTKTQVVTQEPMPDVTGLEPDKKKRKPPKVGTKKVDAIPLVDEAEEQKKGKYRRKLKSAKSVETESIKTFAENYRKKNRS